METGIEALLDMIEDVAREAKSVTSSLGIKLKKHYGFSNTVIYNDVLEAAEGTDANG